MTGRNQVPAAPTFAAVATSPEVGSAPEVVVSPGSVPAEADTDSSGPEGSSTRPGIHPGALHSAFPVHPVDVAGDPR
ncbi:hypothetical protein [Rhodococcus sp. NPDC058521]|uniref:hypothetical protein n=1 Tax=Rhodococcus sp. NPDC058521 TaxID=3346536 RepID=UPI003646BEEF